jgi:ribonuclease BN (tRNA processing enzyme)
VGRLTIAITVLGSSGMFATADRACSGYLVEIGDKRLWLDAGAGTWQHLLEYIGYEDLDGVLLSHRHPDHTTDMFQAYHARWLGGPEPLPPIPLWAPAETLECVSGFYDVTEDGFILHEIDESTSLQIDDVHFTFFKTAHPPYTLGVRIERDGAVIAYSADSGEEADFAGLAGGADVFLCEATLQDRDELWFGHLRASQAGRIAAEVRAKLTVLTHLPPGRDLALSLAEAQAASGDSDVLLASDGLRLEVNA